MPAPVKRESSGFRHGECQNNEGLPEADLRELLAAKGRCDFHKVAYKRFRADADGAKRQYKGDETQEFLFYVEVGG